MGIQGLLPLLKSIMSPIHIKDLEGSCVAVDTYSWLHKAALSCCAELCKGLPTSRHIDYCMNKVNLLRHYGVKPILVFDGGLLPMKNEQEKKRARSRKENLARAIEHESSGNSAAAYECYQKAVDISPAIAYDLIKVLKQEGVCYVVAPYEADAQMTYLAITKQVDAVITEDSDLIPFGCPRIIYKMDKFGQGVEFQLSMLQHNKDLTFVGFTKKMVLEMCVLSGCDYLPSIPGMGLKRAHALIKKFKTFDKVIKHLRYSTVAVPPLYEESFKKAVWTFQHQRVYDLNKEDIVHLSDISDNIDEDLDFLGPLMPQHIVKAIAKGELDPITKQPFQGENGNLKPALVTSYQLKDFRPESDKKKLDLPAQKNVLTNYFCIASLEAKRKFRAPRVSPKHSDSPSEPSPTLGKQVLESGTDCYINGSTESSLGLVVPNDVISPPNSMETDSSQKESDYLDSQFDRSSGDSLEHDNEYVSHTALGKTNPQVQDATKSSVFLQKSVDQSNLNYRNNEVNLRSSYFLDKVDHDDTDRKSKKVIVRSTYFKHKTSKTTRMDENDGQLHMNNFPVDNCPVDGKILGSLPKTASLGDNHCEDLHIKRKASPHRNDSEDQEGNKHPRSESFMEEKRTDLFNDGDELPSTMPKEEKFGCNISHLGQYSEISGKSMDKFVSVISSFRYNSSGSRASGLRPPLRDVKNICPNRLPAAIDIGKFSYVPSTAKVANATRRR